MYNEAALAGGLIHQRPISVAGRIFQPLVGPVLNMTRSPVRLYDALCGGKSVPIHRLLQEAAFDADATKVMTAAYEAALELLRLKDRSDPLTELIAQKVIEVYRSGARDPARICATALKELGVPVPD